MHANLGIIFGLFAYTKNEGIWLFTILICINVLKWKLTVVEHQFYITWWLDIVEHNLFLFFWCFDRTIISSCHLTLLVSVLWLTLMC
jgi:hypothetical protein